MDLTASSGSQLNTATDFPVFHYQLQLNSTKDWIAFTEAAGVNAVSVGTGCRVFLSMPKHADPALKRP
jgi:hypothetical protein